MVKMYKDFRTMMLYYMNEIKRANPIVVGCSVFDSSRILTEVFLEDLRRHVPGIKHVLGGPGVAHFMKNTDDLISLDHIDAVCQDEGENALASEQQLITEVPDIGLTCRPRWLAMVA